MSLGTDLHGGTTEITREFTNLAEVSSFRFGEYTKQAHTLQLLYLFISGQVIIWLT